MDWGSLIWSFDVQIHNLRRRNTYQYKPLVLLTPNHLQPNQHGNQRLNFAPCIPPHGGWILQLGQFISKRPGRCTLDYILQYLSSWRIQVVYSGMGNVRCKFQIYNLNFFNTFLLRLYGILANLEMKRHRRNMRPETGRHICFAGQKLRFPVPSNEEEAEAFFEALDIFSMMIRHNRN